MRSDEEEGKLGGGTLAFGLLHTSQKGPPLSAAPAAASGTEAGFSYVQREHFHAPPPPPPLLLLLLLEEVGEEDLLEGLASESCCCCGRRC